jgi:N-acetylmuramoyl-L-alanine amidase
LQQPESPAEFERAVFANEVAADLVVSIHCDAATSEAAAGIATMYFGSPGGGWSHAGERAAKRIHQALLDATEAEDCNLHARTWDMLRLTRMPAVRVGYVSNPTEAARLVDPNYQEKLAAGLAAGITKFFAPSAS